ncbi:MAG: hypothetical protein OEU32_14085, partial [Acidimicrobiia bacterium]|nr:hypothetical protein [Acidimicrobiia bacterium]
GIIEWDGYRIVVDDANDRFSVVDVETGAEITSGPASDLYRGPPPSFIDVATGEVAVSFSWSEWDELLNSAYDAAYSPHDEHESEHLILFSPDGRDWSEQLLTSGTNIHLESVAAVDDAFVVSLVEHSELGATRIVYTSNDGVDWMEATGDGPEYLDRTSVGPEGVIAMSYDEERSALATSADGRWWNTELSMVPQDDGRDGWLRLVASGDLGHAALATLDAAPGIEVLTITVDGRTARFDAPFSAVQIVDDPTGEILLDLSWDEAQEAVELGEPAYASYAEGATSFWSPDGTLLMTITDDRAQQAFDEQVMRYEAGIDHVLFVRRDEQWFEADVPEATGLSPEQLAVGTDAIVVGTIHSRSDGGTDPVFNEIGVWLGRIG